MGTINKRAKFDSLITLSRLRPIQVMMLLLALYLILVSFEIPMVLKTGLGLESPEGEPSVTFVSNTFIRTQNDNQYSRQDMESRVFFLPERKMGEFRKISGLIFDDNEYDETSKDGFSELRRVARDAFVLGKKVLKDLESGKFQLEAEKRTPKQDAEPCQNSALLSGDNFLKKGKLMVMPCGLSLGSHITVVGRPRVAQMVNDSKIGMLTERKENTMVSQFIMELQGLSAVDGEDPPRILHFNPRLKGDWSSRPVIEQNTCYRMQWGSAQRCEGWKSRADEETVDGLVKCEKWIPDDDSGSEESKASWWLNRLIGRTKKVMVDWPFPFAENKLFVLTLSAGLEGFHINVDGRHISSFSYSPGFTLEDATGLFLSGDVDVHTVFAASLPTSRPNTAPQRHLELSKKWRTPALPARPVDFFIGILSAGNHFAERMAVRKSWMQHKSVKSSNVLARFFVAMVSPK